MIRLGVNIDHVATVRQARRISEPDPAWAVALAELGGADQITIHLREDRRHIQDYDLDNVLAVAKVPVNLEMAVTDEMVQIACSKKPFIVCMVPEKRQEVTTEGGLDVVSRLKAVKTATRKIKKAGVRVSLFIDPDTDQVKAAKEAGSDAIELHTGAYAHAWNTPAAAKELKRLHEAAVYAYGLGLSVHAGHGLNLLNLAPIARLPHIEELNIGHALIGRAIFVGLKESVAQYKARIQEALAGS